MTEDKTSNELIKTKFGSSDESDSRQEKEFTLSLYQGHLFDNK